MTSLIIPTWDQEYCLIDNGYSLIAGIDEVGRGPLAGPVVAAAVILDPKDNLDWYEDLRDSKAISPTERIRLSNLIAKSAKGIGLGWSWPEEIDAAGISLSVQKAMLRAITNLPTEPDHLLIDAIALHESKIPFKSIIKGDSLCRSIAAASIVAKVARDQHMVQAESSYPGYGFAQHKGYGTKQHFDRLTQIGPCDIHRRSFAPIRFMLQQMV